VWACVDSGMFVGSLAPRTSRPVGDTENRGIPRRPRHRAVRRSAARRGSAPCRRAAGSSACPPPPAVRSPASARPWRVDGSSRHSHRPPDKAPPPSTPNRRASQPSQPSVNRRNCPFPVLRTEPTRRRALQPTAFTPRSTTPPAPASVAPAPAAHGATPDAAAPARSIPDRTERGEAEDRPRPVSIAKTRRLPPHSQLSTSSRNTRWINCAQATLSGRDRAILLLLLPPAGPVAPTPPSSSP